MARADTGVSWTGCVVDRVCPFEMELGARPQAATAANAKNQIMPPMSGDMIWSVSAKPWGSADLLPRLHH